MLLKNRVENLKKILCNDNVLISKEERYCYSRDASNLMHHAKVPDLVVFVETIEDVQKIVKYAAMHDIPIVSRGAGTNMVGACVCNEGGIVLNFSKMNKILNINPVNLTVTVQPGVVLGDLKKAVEEVGLFYPPDPSNFKVSTVGGSIAQSSGGANSFKYGTTKDYVLSLKVVTAEGNLMTVGAGTTKDSVGYHLKQLFVGSEGTLGIIVEATLKIIPRPESRMVFSASFENAIQAVNLISSLLNSGIYPTAIDYMDNNSINTVEEFANIGLNTNAKNLVILEIDGQRILLEQLQEKVHQVLIKNHAFDIKFASTESECESIWQARRVSFAAATRLAPDVISDDIVVPRENLATMIDFCTEIANKENLRMSLVAHLADGDIHPQITLDLNNEQEFEKLMKIKTEMYKKAVTLGGTISGEHGIGLEKMPYIDKVLDKEALEYMKFIKRSFDPKNILNPGKIFKLK